MDRVWLFDSPGLHDLVYLLKVFKFFNSCFDQFWYNGNPVGIFCHEAHRGSRSFPFAISMVLQKGVEIC